MLNIRQQTINELRKQGFQIVPVSVGKPASRFIVALQIPPGGHNAFLIRGGRFTLYLVEPGSGDFIEGPYLVGTYIRGTRPDDEETGSGNDSFVEQPYYITLCFRRYISGSVVLAARFLPGSHRPLGR